MVWEKYFRKNLKQMKKWTEAHNSRQEKMKERRVRWWATGPCSPSVSVCLSVSVSLFLRQLQQGPLVNPREDLWSWNFSEVRWIWLFHPSSCREGAPGKRADLGFYSSLQLQAIPGETDLAVSCRQPTLLQLRAVVGAGVGVAPSIPHNARTLPFM